VEHLGVVLDAGGPRAQKDWLRRGAHLSTATDSSSWSVLLAAAALAGSRG